MSSDGYSFPYMQRLMSAIETKHKVIYFGEMNDLIVNR